MGGNGRRRTEEKEVQQNGDSEWKRTEEQKNRWDKTRGKWKKEPNEHTVEQNDADAVGQGRVTRVPRTLLGLLINLLELACNERR